MVHELGQVMCVTQARAVSDCARVCVMRSSCVCMCSTRSVRRGGFSTPRTITLEGSLLFNGNFVQEGRHPPEGPPSAPPAKACR
jgi:hypothetical protein